MKTQNGYKKDKNINDEQLTPQEKIYQICENYFNLSLKCAKDLDMDKAFKDPKKTSGFLTDGKYMEDGKEKYVWLPRGGEPWNGCGMTLPPNTPVILKYEIDWPTLVLTKADNSHIITITESPLNVHIMCTDKEIEDEILKKNCDYYSNIDKLFSKKTKQNQNKTSKLKMADAFEIDLSEIVNLNNYNLTLHMPCFMPDKDFLTEVKCEGDEEDKYSIILTSC